MHFGVAEVELDPLSVTLAAVADPTRRALLNHLMKGPRSVNELAEPFRMTQQGISKHLTLLEKANLIEKKKVGRQSMCQLKPQPLQELSNWVEQYRTYWEEAVDRLETFLTELERREEKNGK
jgi:DNA-binding transcriptional ArsR family regulator